MADDQDLLGKATALGQALASHPRVREHYAAQRGVREDAAAQQLLRDYQTHLNHIHQLEAEQKPIEVADKQKLKDFETQMAGNEALKALMRTQANYVALMAQVNQAMEAPLAGLRGPEPAK